MGDSLINKKHFGADQNLGDDTRISRVWGPEDEREETNPAVYFALAVGGNLIKIGTVADIRLVQRRMELLQPGCPYALKVLLIVPGCGRQEEVRLHRLYRPYKFRSEWFRCEGRLKTMLQIAAVEGDDAAMCVLFSQIC